MTEKTSRASFSLQDEYIELLRELAWRDRKTMTDELRSMINEKAIQKGLDPIQESAQPEAIEELA